MLKQSILLVMMFFAVSAWSSNFQLNGDVTTYHSSEPVASCRIILRPESPTAVPDTTATDNNGHYYITDVSPGVYSVRAESDLYISIPQRIAVDDVVTADFMVALKSHIAAGDLPEKLTKDMSPIFILTGMNVGHKLVIEAGVTIYYLDSLTLGGSSVTAAGRVDDPVTFVPLNEEIDMRLTSSDQKFTNCIFKKGRTLNVYPDSGIQKSTFDSCTFSANDLQFTSTVLKIHQSTIKGANSQCYADSIVFTGNNFAYFDQNHAAMVTFYITKHGLISDNTLPYTQLYLQADNDTVSNNIFSYLNIDLSYNPSPNISFNCIPGLSNTNSPSLVGIGKAVIKNDNGFPCDLFFNITTDPLIEDLATGKLSKESPCYRAGYKGTNIGAWKQEQYATHLARRNPESAMRHSMAGGHPMVVPIWNNNPAGSPLVANRSGQLTRATIYQLNGRRIATSGNSGASYGSSIPGRAGHSVSNGIYILEQYSH